MKKKTPCAMKRRQPGRCFQLLYVWAASRITSHKSTLCQIYAQGTNIFLKSHFWVTLCMSTKLKAQSKLHNWTTLRISSSETAAEVKSSTFAGFSLLLIFLCNGAGQKRRDTEKFWCDDDPISPMLPAWLLSVCPQELYVQTQLQSPDVLSDLYEAEVSMMKER